MSENGKVDFGKVDTGTALDGKTEPLIITPQMDAAVLRKMNHKEWLGEFAKILQMQRGGVNIPMTPFRKGTIGRLQLAEQYIMLLEKELHWLSRDNKVLRRQVHHLGGVVGEPFDAAAEELHDPTPQAS